MLLCNSRMEARTTDWLRRNAAPTHTLWNNMLGLVTANPPSWINSNAEITPAPPSEIATETATVTFSAKLSDTFRRCAAHATRLGTSLPAIAFQSQATRRRASKPSSECGHYRRLSDST